jgi:VWFA-related protein
MRHFRTGSLSVIVIAAGVLCISPATAARKRGSQAQPSAPAGLVTFELSALGPRNEPVTDLRSGECQVSEDGKRQAITLFHYDGNSRKKDSPNGPQEFSNRDGFAVRPTIVLLDLLSERLLTWGQAEGELVKALEGVPSGDGLYVYILMNQGSFYAVHALPKTEAELRTENPKWTQEVRPLLDGVSRELAGFRPMDDQDPWLRTQLTVRVLGQFAASLAVIPGRKNLVWITHGIPTVVPGLNPGEPVDLRPQLRQLGESFVQANVAVYTVAQSAAGAGESMGYSWESLQLLSSLTGGRPYSSDNIGNAITEATADAWASYVVGYYPSREKDDGKFHKLRVTCARKGLRLQTQAGYWAFLVQSSPAEREHAALEAAAVSPFDNSGIGLRLTVAPHEKPSTTARVQIHIDSADLLPPDQSDPHHRDLAIELVAYTANGTIQRATTSLFQPNQDQAGKKEIEVSRDLAIDDASQNIRVIVYDGNLNLTGSVTIPIIPAAIHPERPSGKS